VGCRFVRRCPSKRCTEASSVAGSAAVGQFGGWISTAGLDVGQFGVWYDSAYFSPDLPRMIPWTNSFLHWAIWFQEKNLKNASRLVPW
jgi:hypothetical protein